MAALLPALLLFAVCAAAGRAALLAGGVRHWWEITPVIGMMALTVYAAILMALGTHVGLTSQALFGGVAVGCWLLLERRQSRKESLWRQSAGALRHPLILLLAPVAVYLLVDASAPFLTYDARAIYGIKAKILIHQGTMLTEEFLNPHYVQFHPRYPPLAPVLTATTFLFAGTVIESAARSFFPWLFLTLVAVLYRSLRLHLGRSEAVAGTAMLATLPVLLMWRTNGASTIYTDIPLGLCVFVLFLLVSGEMRIPRAALWTGCCGAAAILTKNEGLVLFGILLMGRLLFDFRHSWRFVSGAASTAVLLLLPWWWVQSHIVPDAGVAYWTHLGDFHPDRLPQIVMLMLREWLCLPYLCGLLWVSGAWFLWRDRRHWRNDRSTFLICWLLGNYTILLVIIYAVTPYSMPNQMQVSFTRLMMHVAPVVVWYVSRQFFLPALKST